MNQTAYHRQQRAHWAADFHCENHRWPTVHEYEDWHRVNNVPFLTEPVPSGTPSIRSGRRLRIILRAVLAVLLLAVLRACDVDLTFFEDGSGMVSWCEPFNPCMEYKP